MILDYVMQILSQLIGIIVWVWMVISAQLPEGLYKPLRASVAYQVKAYAFWLLLTEDYPPFWVDEDEELAGLGGAEPPPATGAPA
jgi:hypothetical protein